MLSIDLAALPKHKSSFVALMKEKHGSNDFVFVCVALDAKSKSNGSIGRRRAGGEAAEPVARPMIQGGLRIPLQGARKYHLE